MEPEPEYIDESELLASLDRMRLEADKNGRFSDAALIEKTIQHIKSFRGELRGAY